MLLTSLDQIPLVTSKEDGCFPSSCFQPFCVPHPTESHHAPNMALRKAYPSPAWPISSSCLLALSGLASHPVDELVSTMVRVKNLQVGALERKKTKK